MAADFFLVVPGERGRTLLEADPGGLDFGTAVCAAIDPSGRVTWASAGRPQPWDLDTGAELAGPPPREPLGVEADLAYASATVDLPVGGGMLLFSDGLTEARAARPDREGRRLFGGLADDLCLLAARRA